MDNKHLSITNDLYGANVLLAPNGKPSNLTPEQYRLVRTPEFKEWFGDWERLAFAKVKDPAIDEISLENFSRNVSKVVDQNGEPKIMWHYSPNKFFVFNPNAKSRWTNQRKENVVWFGGSNKVISYSEGEKGFLYECFLNAKNPIIVDAKDYDVSDYYKDENGNKTYTIQRIKGAFVSKLGEVHWSGKKNDNDGIIFKNAWDNVPLGLVVAIINPNQIKLADGSNTTFDGSNPDIRYAKGGYVPISQFNRNINNELKNYIDEDEEVSFEYKREKVKVAYALKFYEKNNITPLAEPNLEFDSFLWQYVAYNDSDYRIMFHFNFEVGSIKLSKVIATLYSEDYNDEIKTFSHGGEIQNDLDAYEEAMGESFFDEGGKAPIKKVYVSIRLPYDSQRVDGEYFYKYQEKPFLELMSGTLDGVKGVSSSSNNVAEWFTMRGALIVMNYQDFANINNIQVIDYENIGELMANDLFIFRRLYNNLNEYDESEKGLKRVIIDSLNKIGRNISRELNLLLELVDGEKAKEVYRIEKFLNPSETSAFWRWIENNEVKIDNAKSFTKAMIDFNKIDDSYLGSGFPNPTLTIDDLLPSVENGIIYSSKIYESEQEIILLDRKLNIPKGSQLFFKNQTSLNNLDDLIKSYYLDSRYKIYSVDNADLEKFKAKWFAKQEQVFKDRIYKATMDLEEKKNEVLQDLLKKFLDNTHAEIEKSIEKEVEQYSGSKTFLNYDYDKEYQWYELPPIKKILEDYSKIVKEEWEILESNKVKELDFYKFFSFQDTSHQRLKEYFKENGQQLDDELYSYKTLGNNYISLSLLKYDLIKSLYDYENLPQWFSYKDLSKMYLQMMGVDIYRYYDKKDLKLVSQYEVGGQIN